MPTNKNILTKEEQALRDKVNQVNFTYQEADWNAIKDKISGGRHLLYKTLLKATATLTILSGIFYFAYNTKDESSQKVTNETLETTNLNKNNNSSNSIILPDTSIKKQSTHKLTSTSTASEQILSKKPKEEVRQKISNEKTTSLKEKDISNKEEQNKLIEKTDNLNTEKSKEITIDIDVDYTIQVDGAICLGEKVQFSAKSSQPHLNSNFTYKWLVNEQRIIQNTASFDYIFDQI